MAEVRLGKPKVKSDKRAGIREMVKGLTPEQRKNAIKILKRRKQAREMKKHKKWLGKHGGYA